MPSEVDIAKRELVKVLRELAAKYRVNLVLTRESSTKDVEKAFRKVSGKAYLDMLGPDWWRETTTSRGGMKKGAWGHYPKSLRRKC